MGHKHDVEAALGRAISMPEYSYLSSKYANTRHPGKLEFLTAAHAILRTPTRECHWRAYNTATTLHLTLPV